MNKNTLKILSLVAGILVAAVALFDLISNLISLGNFFNANVNDGKAIAYFIIAIIVSLAAVVFYAIVGYFIIKAYVSKTDEEKYMEYPALTYFTFGIIGTLVAMIFWGFGDGNAWVRLILMTSGLVLLILTRFSSFEGNVKNILRLVAVGIGFALSVINLSTSGGLSVLINLLLMIIFVIIFIYYLFKMLMNNDKKEEIVQ